MAYSGRNGGSIKQGDGLSGWLRRHIRTKKQLAVVCVIVLLCVAVAGGAGIWHTVRKQAALHVTGNSSVDMKDGYRSITYQGKQYKYNSLITTVLYAGVDSTGKMERYEQYGAAPRADSISVVVLDEKSNQMTVIALSRDTMTDVQAYSMKGASLGEYTVQLGYSFAYGDGADVSCENLKKAVSNLLGGIPIDEYIVTNQDSMPYINDIVGGVTVQVPNDDLADKYPELNKGNIVKLDDSNITDYLHYRDVDIAYSNEGRIERQQAYVTAYVDLFRTALKQDAEGTWEQINTMNDYLLTSITKSQYLDLAKTFQNVKFSDSDYYRPDGKDQQGAAHDEFYVDEQSLKEKIVELFYMEQ